MEFSVHLQTVCFSFPSLGNGFSSPPCCQPKKASQRKMSPSLPVCASRIISESRIMFNHLLENRKSRKQSAAPKSFFFNGNARITKIHSIDDVVLEDGFTEDTEEFEFSLPEGWADPTPENLFTLGLSAVLLIGAASICWQLLVVAFKVAFAAFKYTAIAAVLVAAVTLLL